MRRITRLLPAVALLFAFAAIAAAPAPDALVRSTVDEVLGVIKKTKDSRVLVELAEKKVLGHFDFRTMTRLAMGRSWAQASPTQQQALERAFRTLLVRTYTTALSQASGDAKVDVKPVALKPGENEAVVTTFASDSGRKPIQIDYRMMRTDAGWKVYDVVVENLSLVINYRSSFQSEISRSGIDGLIRTIEDKNRKLAEGSS